MLKSPPRGLRSKGQMVRDRAKARGEMKRKCISVALSETPKSVSVISPRRQLTGRVLVHSGEIHVPPPFPRRALHISLHECAHIALNHVGKKPRHVEELEAEQWAFRKMREHGIAVPRKSSRRAKRYVAYKIRQAERRGAKHIDAKAKKFAK